MMGSTLTTISPSSRSLRRSTPCVDGCCGPMLSVISCVPETPPPGSRGLLKSMAVEEEYVPVTIRHLRSRAQGPRQERGDPPGSSPRSLLRLLDDDVLAFAERDE